MWIFRRVRIRGWGALLIGVLFALAFCPTSGVFYFGMLIPLSASVTAGYLLPAVFAVATAIPVLAVAWILAFSVQQMGSFYQVIEKVIRENNLDVKLTKVDDLMEMMKW